MAEPPRARATNGRCFELEIPCDLAYVKCMRRFLLSVWRLAGIPQERRDELGLAFTEMCNNSIEHGCSADERDVRGIGISMQIGQGAVELSVRDPGIGDTTTADLQQALAEAHSAPPAGMERGMGLFLVRSLMDEVEVSSDGDDRTVLKAIKRWDG